jgi:NADH-ubiquinone oxidoreductase chain 5
LLIGAVGKSAQIGLHTWLPDAMEGPTPVSALIHAATMVTAGVFLIIRCSFIFEFAPRVLALTAVLGGITALISGTIGVVQNDIKKIIAYSTCSQLGYMILACGLSAYNVSLFHLFNHAFFKALLFLSAGSIIHILSNEQDIRRMGGLATLSPYIYINMVIASLALSGFPFLSGFYSKDLIIESANTKY